MKRTSTLLSFLLISFSLFSQVPNDGFENWTGSMPDDWFSSSGTANVLPDSNAHSGFLAVRLQTVAGSPNPSGTTFATRAVNASTYYPLGSIPPPTSIQFWAITNLVNGDVLTFNNTMTDGGNICSVINGVCVSTNSATYQLYNFPITYSLPGAQPDSSATWFSFRNGSCVPNGNPLNVGSFAIIDGISFNDPTGMSLVHGNEVLQNIFPNPASEVTTLNYKLKNSSDVKIQLFDSRGKEILKENIVLQSAGLHSFAINVADFSDGIYFTTVTTDSERSIRKFIVCH